MKSYIISLLVTFFLLSHAPHTFAKIRFCTATFDENGSLATYPHGAADTFARKGYFQWCLPNGPFTPAAQPGWLFVDEDKARSNRGHFHLSFEDKSINCVTSIGFGRRNSSGKCVDLANPAKEPRYVSTHDGGHWMKAELIVPWTNQWKKDFGITFIEVKGKNPVDLWYQQTNGNWFVYRNLRSGIYNRLFFKSATKVKQVLITSHKNKGSVSFDNFFVLAETK